MRRGSFNPGGIRDDGMCVYIFLMLVLNEKIQSVPNRGPGSWWFLVHTDGSQHALGSKGGDYRVAGLMFSGHLPVQSLWTSLGQKTCSLSFWSGPQASLWVQEMKLGRAEGGSLGFFLLLQLEEIWRPESSLRVGTRGTAGGTERVL